MKYSFDNNEFDVLVDYGFEIDDKFFEKDLNLDENEEVNINYEHITHFTLKFKNKTEEYFFLIEKYGEDIDYPFGYVINYSNSFLEYSTNGGEQIFEITEDDELYKLSIHDGDNELKFNFNKNSNFYKSIMNFSITKDKKKLNIFEFFKLNNWGGEY